LLALVLLVARSVRAQQNLQRIGSEAESFGQALRLVVAAKNDLDAPDAVDRLTIVDPAPYVGGHVF
jgi:hypothetical protein